ncbi:MAG: pentapeptide repeat-containing protein [Candidatus Sumerlaeota bacterium]|nr:pentapeptide repeat-containing protein [Candidatus Sumerlaeota bacterium]
MADIFVLNYLIKTLEAEDGAWQWRDFRRKQREQIDLNQADLESRNLAQYDLSGVNLSGARMYNATLAGADAGGALLTYADLRGANLRGADFRSADLSGAILDQAHAAGAVFVRAAMRGCRLRGADLTGARLAHADLANADLRAALLREANLRRAVLDQADFEGADLSDCQMDDEARERILGAGPSRRKGRAAAALDEGPLSVEEGCRILGVEPGAPEEEIAKAYRRMVMQYHPDRARHLDAEQQEAARREFERVHKAYSSLREWRKTPDGAPAPAPRGRRTAKDFSLQELLDLARQRPNNDRVFYNLGLKLFQEGLVDRAIQAYERALQINPQNRYAEHNLKIARLSQTLSSEGGKSSGQ